MFFGRLHFILEYPKACFYCHLPLLFLSPSCLCMFKQYSQLGSVDIGISHYSR